MGVRRNELPTPALACQKFLKELLCLPSLDALFQQERVGRMSSDG